MTSGIVDQPGGEITALGGSVLDDQTVGEKDWVLVATVECTATGKGSAGDTYGLAVMKEVGTIDTGSITFGNAAVHIRP